MRDVPEPWASRMTKIGMVDPRNGRPSMRRLAEAAETHTSTIAAMMYGTRKTQADVVDRVARALWPDGSAIDPGRRRRDVSAWVGRALETSTPFRPHPDADLLTAKERDAVNEVIRLMAAGKKNAGRANLSVVPDQAPTAAHDEETPIEDEQGHDEHP